MKDLIKLADFTSDDVYEIFNIADEIQQGKYRNFLNNKSIILFFPDTSIRTRVTFEKGIYLLGGQSILFPTETLDKKEDLKDVCGYLNNWADLIVARHKNISVIEQLACYSNVPVVNAMSSVNHPCEIIADMYVLSKIRNDFISDKYLFCGKAGNIGFTWKAASDIMGFELSQCCGKGYEIEGLKTYYCIDDAVKGKDIICTDVLPSDVLPDFKNCRVTRDKMDMANRGALLNPCPPFYRGEEVSDDVISSPYFVGYEFKKHLLEVQQAIIVYLLLYMR